MSGLVWASEQIYQILDTRFRVQAEDGNAGERLHHLLGVFSAAHRTSARGRDTFSLTTSSDEAHPGRWKAYRDCRLVGSAGTRDQTILHLLAHLNRAAVEGYGGFAVHAAVVSHGQTAIAFPAESGVGKTTLASACLQEGFDYGSDEALCVDVESAEVIPYPKPLLLTPWSARALGLDPPSGDSGSELALTAGDLEARAATGPLQLAEVVFPERGAEETSLEEIPRSETVAALLRLSFNHYLHGEAAFRLATRLATESRTWRLLYSDPEEAAQLLRDRLAV